MDTFDKIDGFLHNIYKAVYDLFFYPPLVEYGWDEDCDFMFGTNVASWCHNSEIAKKGYESLLKVNTYGSKGYACEVKRYLSVMNLHGCGTKKDYGKALKYFYQSADQCDDAESLFVIQSIEEGERHLKYWVHKVNFRKQDFITSFFESVRNEMAGESSHAEVDASTSAI
ncbi:MAG: SEL1-like repeat protein [Rickettsiales bacterium]